jgi:hypothetical protein
MRHLIATSLSLLLLLPAPTAAQSAGATEFGVDLGLSVTDPDFGDNLTMLSIPVGTLRVGFHVSDAVSVEPRVSFNYAASDGDDVSVLDLTGALLYAVTESFYVFGEAGFIRVSAGDSESEGQFGGGIGFRKAVDDDFGLRFEFGALVIDETTIFGAKAGLSFFRGGD